MLMRLPQINESMTSLISNEEKDNWNVNTNVDLSSNNLPDNINKDNINNWTLNQSFEIIKHILTNYDNLLQPTIQFHDKLILSQDSLDRQESEFAKPNIKLSTLSTHTYNSSLMGMKR